VEGSTTLAHIVFDGAKMVDTTGHTQWSQVGAPGAHATGMWAPVQSYSGSFSSSAYWTADAASKSYLDQHTAGDFTVCARYKPGRYPGGSAPNKIIIANGNPEGSGHGGWSLMQMHEAFCFHYHDSSANGEWMGALLPQIDSETVFSMEWTWHCGGRDGADIRGLWESYVSGMMAVGGQTTSSVGPFQPSTDLPTIGAYADGSSPLFDGGVYEIIVKAEPATFGNMFRTVAEASGGIRAANQAPAQVLGADGAIHLGAPSTVSVQPGGTVIADSRIWVAEVLQHDPTSSGECYGMVASSPDWTRIGQYTAPLMWSLGNASSALFWNDPIHSQCLNAYDPTDGIVVVCGQPPVLPPGSRHTFLNCFNTSDRFMRMYADGNPVPFAVSGSAIALTLFPRLDDPQSTFGLYTDSNAASLDIHRVFACSTADPSSCK
jgi:hypothetical protein